MLMIWSTRCTFHTRMKMELEFLSGLGLISSRGSQGSHSFRGPRLAVLPGLPCLVGVVCWVLGGGHSSLHGDQREGGHEGVVGD